MSEEERKKYVEALDKEWQEKVHKKSKKQKSVALSSCEAEIVAASEAAADARRPTSTPGGARWAPAWPDCGWNRCCSCCC